MLERESRKQEILRTIIQAYVHTAEPVGSETVAHRLRLGVSPATIRNEMAALEEMGFLSHPHTSAGRVPTDRGYRFYVDAMLPDVDVTPQERVRIRRQFAGLLKAHAGLPEHIARALAALTRYASVVAEPQPDAQVFKHLHLIPLASTQVMAVIVTRTGMIEAKMLELTESLDPEALDRLSGAVSQRLEGVPIAEITDDVLAHAVDEAAWQERILSQLIQWLRRDLPAPRGGRVHIEGTANILRQPEFRDAKSAQSVLSALERDEVVADLLRPAPSEAASRTESVGAGPRATPARQVWITIGSEHRHEDLRGCSVVATAYQMGGQAGGALGIVGPTRMNYAKVISLIRYLADRLSEPPG